MREAPVRRVLLPDLPPLLPCHTVPAPSADLAPVHGARARTAHAHAHAMDKRAAGEGVAEGGVAAELRDKLSLRGGVNGIKLGTTDVEVHVPALKCRPPAVPTVPPPEEPCSESSQESKSDLNGAVCNGHTVSEATSSGSIAVSDTFSLASERSSDSSQSLCGARPRTRHTSGGSSQGTQSTPAHDLSLSSASDSLVTPEICISPVPAAAAVADDLQVEYINYENELQMSAIMRLIQKDLSEPYSIYTYRYFIHNWPKLCFLAVSNGEVVGAIVCKLDVHKKVTVRGYIAMLAVDHRFRKRKIGSNLVQRAIRAMATDDADEVVLETEITNKPALRLYENLGFVRDKRLFRYYLNGVDALRLKLWLR
ncbi:N-alpha-acetyltransferase 30-like isoform X2 [Eriocheir sinensis]|uniref:N-alpha-acetyltransferase 30-like isoform X2 n=1 Tax=Eriocheir sinensis TaxID=95602 RepID=UPI0021C7DE77|nr:N-alpha-acetyltransferase 30-like isoform X2 [Eriocheir sinensis]